MSRPLVFAALLALASPLGAQSPSGPVRVQVDAMPTSSVVVMLMRDVLAVPYVIGPEVLNDHRPVSVNLTMPRADLPMRVIGHLRGMGLTVTLRGGTVYVTKGPLGANVEGGAAVPSGSPLAPAPVAAPVEPRSEIRSDNLNEPPRPVVLAVIEPAHRPVIELAGVLEGVLPDLTIAARPGSEPQGDRIVDHLEPEALVISGPREVIDQAIAIVRLLDKPRPTVEIRAVVFEVRTSRTNSSALSILAELGGLDIGSNAGDIPGEQFVRIAAGGIKAVLSATKGDGRFRVVAEPSLSTLSGTVARLNSGSQVPTLGSVSFSEDGTPIRSVVYRDSGISLSVRPVVRPGGIEIAVEQERSTFVPTNTGVDDSPTLNRSTASAQIALRPGETVALAGLDERSEGSTSSGFFGGLLKSRSKDSGEGQLLLLLQADVPAEPRSGELVVHILEPEPLDSAPA